MGCKIQGVTAEQVSVMLWVSLLSFFPPLFFSPLHDPLQPRSCCTSHSADMADASPSPEMSPSQLPWQESFIKGPKLHVTNLPETEQPTKVDPLVTPGAHVCLPRKGGDASSWNEEKHDFTGYWASSSSRVKESLVMASGLQLRERMGSLASAIPQSGQVGEYSLNF